MTGANVTAALLLWPYPPLSNPVDQETIYFDMVHVQDIHVLLEFFSGIRSVVGSGAAAADMEAAVDQG